MNHPALPNEQLEAIANSLARRLWRGVILPGIGLQFVLFLAFSFSLSLASVRAQDEPDSARTEQQTELRAALPDDGQPPVPSAPVASAPVPTATVEPTPLPKPEEPTAESSAAKELAAEVSDPKQVEQLVTPTAGNEQVPTAEVRELSVEPVTETRIKLPADRPAWVGAPNDLSERVHRLYVASFSGNSRDSVEEDDMLDEPMVAAVRSYLDKSVFPGQGALKLPITADFVRNNLLDKSTSYVAAMNTQSGTEYQKWVVLQVTPVQREYFAQQLREHTQLERLAALGIGLAGVLGLTGVANLGFNRRRKRYPSAVTPLTMAIMPAGAAGVFGNAVQHVTIESEPAMVTARPRKKKLGWFMSLVMILATCVVFGLVVQAIVIKSGVRPHRTEHTRVEFNGKVWEIKTTRSK